MKKQEGSVSVEKVSRNVIKIHLSDIHDGWEQWLLLSSDRHHDSISSDKAFVKKHLDEARKRNAKILDFGDFFDCMQGKYDPRRSYPDMDKKYLEMMQSEGIGYLDAIVKDAVAFYKQYADMFVLISKGNHETAIYNHNDTDLTNRLVYGLNAAAGSQIHTGEYGGWVQFMFTYQKTVKCSRKLKYFHGSGGGGPVTKGVIQSNRQAVIFPDADIVANGHIHESWIVAIPRERISANGVVYKDNQYHVRTGTYKDEYGDGGGGWAVEKGLPPKPIGAVWLRFFYSNNRIELELTQALK